MATRLDGTRFYDVFNTESSEEGASAARYRRGDVVMVADAVLTPLDRGGGGCVIASSEKPFAPLLPALVALGLSPALSRREAGGFFVGAAWRPD